MNWRTWAAVVLICGSQGMGAWYIAHAVDRWARVQAEKLDEQVLIEKQQRCILTMTAEKRDAFRGHASDSSWSAECDWIENVKE